MNRFKKELRKKGIKLEADYPCLPFYIKGRSCFEPGFIYIDAVIVNSEKATWTECLNVVNITSRLNRNGQIENVDLDFD